MVSRLILLSVLCLTGCSAVTVYEPRVCNMGHALVEHHERQQRLQGKPCLLWTGMNRH